jgi:hypothetical protein
MPADRSRQYGPDQVYDATARGNTAVLSSQTRATRYLMNGQPEKAQLALARGLVTEHQWLSGTHPALVISTAHPEATTTLTRHEENALITHHLAVLAG